MTFEVHIGPDDTPEEIEAKFRALGAKVNYMAPEEVRATPIPPVFNVAEELIHQPGYTDQTDGTVYPSSTVLRIFVTAGAYSNCVDQDPDAPLHQRCDAVALAASRIGQHIREQEQL